MGRNLLAGVLTVIGIGALASCSDQHAPAAPEPGVDALLGIPIGPPRLTSWGYHETPPPPEHNGDFACYGGETVLLIQDVVPWFVIVPPGDEGGDVNELQAQGKNFCRIRSSEIGTTDLPAFAEILIAADQNQEFYDNLFPGGTVHQAISDYVEHGGILSANLTDFGMNLGTWVGDRFVAGVEHVPFASNLNDIADPSHPVIADALPCPSGNCGPIVDGPGVRDDLDGWAFDSHGSFTNLPAGTQVILVDELGQPVMVEYRYHLGTVIATLTTTEWRYQGDGTGQAEKKLLANEIAYQDCLAGHDHAHETGPCVCRPHENGHVNDLPF
jgi:hypothetical protein